MHASTAEPPQPLPRLDAGVTLLTRPSHRSVSLHRIVVNELRQRDGTTLWVDARNNASTHTLYDFAPSSRTLDGVRIARAFTAYQHHSLVSELVERATGRTAMIVAPCVASLYEDDDVPDREGHDLLSASLMIMRELGSALDIPVLVSSEPATAGSTALVHEYADATIDVTETQHGCKYTADGFETRVYWHAGYWQTTIPYWVELLGAVETGAFVPSPATGVPEARA